MTIPVFEATRLAWKISALEVLPECPTRAHTRTCIRAMALRILVEDSSAFEAFSHHEGVVDGRDRIKCVPDKQDRMCGFVVEVAIVAPMRTSVPGRARQHDRSPRGTDETTIRHELVGVLFEIFFCLMQAGTAITASDPIRGLPLNRCCIGGCVA